MPSLSKASKRRSIPRDRRGRFVVAAEPCTENFRLFDLPRELRDMIYGFAMVDHKLTPINQELKPPPLTQVSRQTREETLPIYWQKNQFAFTIGPLESPNLLGQWLRETKDLRSRYLHPRKLLVIFPPWVLESDIFFVLWTTKQYPEQSFLLESEQPEHRRKCEDIVAHLGLGNVCISGLIQVSSASG